MKTNYLKIARIVISLLFLVTGSFLFVDFTGVSPDMAYVIFSHVQFIPSLLTLISAFSIAGLVSILLIVITAFFGRVYCSTFCPLGILQDVISFISRKTSKKRKIFRFQNEWKWTRYIILAVVILVSITGFTLLLNLLDPYSNFGKIFSVLIRPVYVQGNNFLAMLLEKVDNYWLYSVDVKQHGWTNFIYPGIFLGVVLFFSFLKGRLYCNSICPVGTFLGLISKISVFKIKIDKEGCIKCGKCSVVCKSGCIDIRSKEVDFSRCVGCFNCLKTCPDNAIGYRYAFQKSEKKEDASRRNFLIQATALTAVAVASKNIILASETPQETDTGSNIPMNRKGVVTPPGSVNIEHFNKTCTACHLCVSICPMRVLQPSVTKYGIKGFMQPYMDYSSSYCNFECTKCTRVCPSGALTEVSHEAKKTLQLGLVHFIKENCIVYINEKSCGACAEHCPSGAVTMVPYKGSLTIPETIQSICIGCGACEYVCPARPNKSIFVDANPIHKIAEKPKEQQQPVQTEEQKKEDFPF